MLGLELAVGNTPAGGSGAARDCDGGTARTAAADSGRHCAPLARHLICQGGAPLSDFHRPVFNRLRPRARYTLPSVKRCMWNTYTATNALSQTNCASLLAKLLQLRLERGQELLLPHLDAILGSRLEALHEILRCSTLVCFCHVAVGSQGLQVHSETLLAV